MEERHSPKIIPFLILITIFVVVVLIPKYLRKRKIKKLKYEGGGIVKKATVSEVMETYVSGDDDSAGYYLYRLKAEDENGGFYISESFKNAEHGGRTLEEMVKKYDGVTYDLGNKDEAIRQVNDNIQRLEMELQNNPGFFKKLGLKKDIKAMKNYLDIANEGPITPYLVCNGHKVSVGDTVDVFVDPENPKSYYVDLEFSNEK